MDIRSGHFYKVQNVNFCPEQTKTGNSCLVHEAQQSYSNTSHWYRFEYNHSQVNNDIENSSDNEVDKSTKYNDKLIEDDINQICINKHSDNDSDNVHGLHEKRKYKLNDNENFTELQILLRSINRNTHFYYVILILLYLISYLSSFV